MAIAVELVGLVALPLAFVLLPHGWDTQAALQAFAGGAIGGLGLVAFYRAMSLNLIGVVAPITGSVAAALPVTVGLIGGDHLEIWQVAGIVAGLAALVFDHGPSREGSATHGSAWPWRCLPASRSVCSSSSSMMRATPV